MDAFESVYRIMFPSIALTGDCISVIDKESRNLYINLFSV